MEDKVVVTKENLSQDVKDHISFFCNEWLKEILTEASVYIENMEANKTKPATKLAGEIGDKFSLSQQEAYSILVHFFKEYPGVEVRKGAHGGIRKL